MRATLLNAPVTKPIVRLRRLAFVSLLTLIAQADDYTYTVNEGAITITRYQGSGGAVFVPATIGSLPVTRIGPSAFAYRSEVTGVTIPAEVGSIEHSAFRGCDNLTDLTLPTGLTNIGAYAFSLCTRLGKVTIPAGIQQVGDGAFQNCASLDTVEVSEGISRLGDYAFHGCRHLAHVNIPASLREIGIGAFAACSSLSGIQVAALNPNYRSDDGILFDQARDFLQQYPGGRTGDYVVPPGVSGIRAVAFQGCAGLTSATIPASVTAIGSGAFDACTNLLSIAVDPRNASYQSAEGVLFASDRTELVRYPPGKAGSYAVPGIVTTIDDSAFADAVHLEQVTLPDSVHALGVAVFANCSQLRRVALSTALTNIPGSTFSSCTSLGEVVIHGGVISLDDSAFSDCSTLTNVALSAGLRAIGGMTFAGCTQLADLALPEGLTSLGYGAFLGCSSLREMTIPDGVISLGANAFDSCEQLTRVRLPARLGRLEYGTFAWCSSLTNVDLPEGVAALEDDAFYACTSLKELTLPATLARIGAGAFDSCASLEVLDCRGNPPTAGVDVFQGADQVIVYYRAGTRGWETTFGGRPTALWGAPPPIVPGFTVFPIATNDGVVNVGGIGACDGTNFLAAYVSGNSYYAQVIRPDGRGQGSPIWLGDNPAFTPAVVATYGAGSYLVLWTDGLVGSGVRIFGQRIAPTGLKLGGRHVSIHGHAGDGPHALLSCRHATLIRARAEAWPRHRQDARARQAAPGHGSVAWQGSPP